MSGEPIFVLIDDHVHSARLLSRTLRALAGPARLIWLGNAERARRKLPEMLESGRTAAPDLIIVDLKSYSGQTADFAAEFARKATAAGVPVVAFSGDTGDAAKRRLHESGVAAVFERHHDLAAYRSEIEKVMTFWVHETRTWPIRA